MKKYKIASDYYEFYFEANLDIKIYICEYNKSNATNWIPTWAYLRNYQKNEDGVSNSIILFCI